MTDTPTAYERAVADAAAAYESTRDEATYRAALDAAAIRAFGLPPAPPHITIETREALQARADRLDAGVPHDALAERLDIAMARACLDRTADARQEELP